MSNYWDIGCKDCDELIGFHVNHGEDQLAAIVPLVKSLAIVPPEPFDALCGIPEWRGVLGVEWMLHRGDSYGPELPEVIRFARRHQGHSLSPRDEYGTWMGDCDRSIKCSECGTRAIPCALPYGHKGECSANPRPGE